MQKKNVEGRTAKAQKTSWVRASISFPAEIHRTLEDIAQRKKVSLAWVVRDAVDKYVAVQPAQRKNRD